MFINPFAADGYTKMFENMLLNNPDITGSIIAVFANRKQCHKIFES